MNPLRIFLLSVLILVVFGVKEVDAEGTVIVDFETKWNYDLPLYYGEEYTYFVGPVAISADGKYIVTEASKAVIDGFSEITLLGQNVNSYNHNKRGFE